MELKNISKRFPGVIAVNDVSLDLYKGEILGLVGENGAGKSTLINVLCGIYPYGTYTGDVVFNGQVMKFKSQHDATKSKLAHIHQELSLFPNISIAENIFAGKWPAKRNKVQWKALHAGAAEILDKLNIAVQPETLVSELGAGLKQLVEIAKALSSKREILVLDEPTGALSNIEIKRLFELLKMLKNEGVSCIFISHRMEEVFEISDRIAVMKDGVLQKIFNIAEATKDAVVSAMVGGDLNRLFPEKTNTPAQPWLEIKNFCVHDPVNPKRLLVSNVTFSVKKGEILGIAGLLGAGRTELLSAIFGISAGKWSGELYLDGKKISNKPTARSIENGIVMVTEDRQQSGYFPNMTIGGNITASILEQLAALRLVRRNGAEKTEAESRIKQFSIVCPGTEGDIRSLSGGNLQKVILGRYVATNPKVMLLDQPTEGIDVGAKSEIYKVMNELATNGMSFIMVSSDFIELMGCCDRIIVMCKGRLSREYFRQEFSEDRLMQDAMGLIH